MIQILFDIVCHATKIIPMIVYLNEDNHQKIILLLSYDLLCFFRYLKAYYKDKS